MSEQNKQSPEDDPVRKALKESRRITVSADFEERLRRRISADEGRPEQAGGSMWGRKWRVPAFATILVASVATFFLLNRQAPEMPVVPPQRVSPETSAPLSDGTHGAKKETLVERRRVSPQRSRTADRDAGKRKADERNVAPEPPADIRHAPAVNTPTPEKDTKTEPAPAMVSPVAAEAPAIQAAAQETSARQDQGAPLQMKQLQQQQQVPQQSVETIGPKALQKAPLQSEGRALFHYEPKVTLRADSLMKDTSRAARDSIARAERRLDSLKKLLDSLQHSAPKRRR